LKRLRLGVSTLLTVAVLVSATTTAGSAAAQERSYRGPDGVELAFSDNAEIERALSEGSIEEVSVLSEGTTGVERLVLKYGDLRLRAAFRHVDQYERNIRLRDGTAYAGFYDRYSAECAAYELSLMLGLDMIPPAVIRRVDGRPGSVQLWVEDAMTEGERASQNLQPPKALVWRRQQATMRAFDALVHNSDRNTGNSLIDENWNLWLIDHSRTFQIPRGGVDFSGLSQIPGPLYEAIAALDESAVRERLGDFLERPQISALWERREKLLAHFDRLIEERGRGAVIIP
jgi:hypothetical protein